MADVFHYEEAIVEEGELPSIRAGVPIERGNSDTDMHTGRRLCGGQGEASISQGCQDATKHQKLGERHQVASPSQSSEGAHPADTSILLPQPPEL